MADTMALPPKATMEGTELAGMGCADRAVPSTQGCHAPSTAGLTKTALSCGGMHKG